MSWNISLELNFRSELKSWRRAECLALNWNLGFELTCWLWTELLALNWILGFVLNSRPWNEFLGLEVNSWLWTKILASYWTLGCELNSWLWTEFLLLDRILGSMSTCWDPVGCHYNESASTMWTLFWKLARKYIVSDHIVHILCEIICDIMQFRICVDSYRSAHRNSHGNSHDGDSSCGDFIFGKFA